MAKNIGIVLNSPTGYSETFIQAHIHHLNAAVIYSSSFPDYQHLQFNNKSKEAQSFLNKIFLLGKSIFYSILNKLKEREVKRFFSKNSIKLLLAEYGEAGVAVMNVCKKYKMPLVVHFHGYDAYVKSVLLKHEKAYLELFEYADAIIVVSKDMERQLLSVGAPISKLHYNVYGVDISKFMKGDVMHSPPQLLTVGRFVEKKAPYLTILAFNQALKVVPDAKLVMVGDGILLDVCKQLIKSLKISENITLTGALPHEEILLLMRQSRAFIQHSLTPASGDSEGTPNSILEAAACGLPVVSTLHAGIKDVVVHNHTGFLVEEGDVDAMATYMIDLLKDPLLAKKMGEAGEKNILENYTMSKSIGNLKKILKY